MMLAMSLLADRVMSRLRFSDVGGEEDGQGMVEYAFILVMVVLVVLITLILLGNQTRNLYSNIATQVGGA